MSLSIGNPFHDRSDRHPHGLPGRAVLATRRHGRRRPGMPYLVSMNETDGSRQAIALLAGLGPVLDAPHDQVTARLSALLSPLVPHLAVASLADGCARSPLSVHGDPQITPTLRAPELARLAAEVGVDAPVRRRLELGDEEHPVLAVAASSETTRSLLVLVCADDRESWAGADFIVQQVWALVVENLGRRLIDARPEDLSVSRAVSAERARLANDMSVEHRAVLMALLGVLRSGGLDDATARRSATDLAASALVHLRATAKHEQAVGDETAEGAFGRLRNELRPIARYGQAELSFASPDSSQPLPAQVAQAARAVARNAVLAMLEQQNVTRIRVGWTLEDDLIVTVHDDGPGRIAARGLAMLELTAQAEAVDGQLELESVPDWGTRVRARLPLTIRAQAAENPLDRLQPREREVLELVAAGRRNREIAAALHISENTVKFHVGNILRKLEAGSRGQAAALARQHAGGGSAGAGVVDLRGRRSQTDRRFG
jgi:DNA-binding CsgD family transcriptional regulator/signal transduction histidine kinase